MAKIMNLRTHTNKKGSYIIEAAITLPVFLIALIVMSSIILMYVCIEDCNFIAANELRRGAAEAVIADTSLAIPHRIRKEIEENHTQIKSSRLNEAGLRISRWGTDELLTINYTLILGTNNPLGIKAEAEYNLSLVTRAYVGKERDETNMPVDEFADEDSIPVYIFPKRGEKYHSEGCRFLEAASRSGTLTVSMKKQYKSCPTCHSGRADPGSLIYYFPAAGEDYHLPGCASLQRNYVEIDRDIAIERGYTACSKCGG